MNSDPKEAFNALLEAHNVLEWFAGVTSFWLQVVSPILHLTGGTY
jgi:hypothetical protein